MPKMTDYVALWEKYQREGVPQKIPIERFCVMNGYTYKQSYRLQRAIFRSKKDTVYFVTFWAFKELDHFPLDSIDFRFNQSLDHLKVGRGEVLSPHSKQPVSICYGYEYNDITINVDNKSRYVKLISGKNYKGILGEEARQLMK